MHHSHIVYFGKYLLPDIAQLFGIPLTTKQAASGPIQETNIFLLFLQTAGFGLKVPPKAWQRKEWGNSNGRSLGNGVFEPDFFCVLCTLPNSSFVLCLPFVLSLSRLLRWQLDSLKFFACTALLRLKFQQKCWNSNKNVGIFLPIACNLGQCFLIIRKYLDLFCRICSKQIFKIMLDVARSDSTSLEFIFSEASRKGFDWCSSTFATHS